MSSPAITVYLDYQFPTDKFSFRIYKQDTPVIRCWLTVNRIKFQPTSDNSCLLAYATTGFETNSAPITITGTVSTTENYIDFVIPDTITNGDYFSQIVLRNNVTSKQWVWGDGKMSIKRKAGVA